MQVPRRGAGADSDGGRGSVASSPNPRERSGAAQYSEGGRGEAALRVAPPPLGPSEKAKVSLNRVKYGMHEK